MPKYKLKTKSAVKKRFKVTGSGKIKAQAMGKRHGMIKRTAKFIRDARGTMVLSEVDIKRVKQFMPYARKPMRRKARPVDTTVAAAS